MPIIVLTTLIAASIPAVAADPTPFRAVYKAHYKGFPLSATGIRELKKLDGNQYLLTSTAKNFLAKIAEQTKFSVAADNSIVPDEYQYHRTGIGKNRTAVLTFDWDKMKVLNDVQSKPWSMAIVPGTQDKLSYQFALRNDLVAAHERGIEHPEFHYRIADGGELKEYSFKIVGTDKIKTPIGTFDTVKATRTDGNPDRVTNFWLAPKYDYLLVRFEQTEPDGKGFELLLREAEFAGKKVTTN